MEENSFNSEKKKGEELILSGGLSQTAVLKKQELEGLNELPASAPKKIYSFIFDVLKEPMVYLLLGCGVIYFFLGDQQEALMLLTFLFLIIGITIFQEAKSSRALEALRDLSSPRALVLRNGSKVRVAGKEVVTEDIIFFNEGDRIAADATVISGSNLAINESLLTGESLPVNKSIGAFLFASTTVIRGQGVGIVTAIGARTQVGQIGSSIQEDIIIPTRLEKQTNQLVKKLAWFALFLCILVIGVHSIINHNIIEGILIGLSLGMAILPNELPAILTIFFALGAWRLSKRKVLTRKISAVENLGSITVLCVDKTGTLTLNQMAIQKIYSQDQFIDLSEATFKSLPEEFHETLEFGILASRKDPFDPMELAFSTAGIKYLKGTEHLHHDWNLEKEYPLSPELLTITHAWKPNSGGGFIIGVKGAPEAIIDLCHMSKEQIDKSTKIADEMAALGLRILGVAKSNIQTSELPSKQHDFEFSFLGFIGITDPIRSGVKESIAECQTAGIRVIMLTGDHPITAISIATKIGLQNPTIVITGSEIEKLSDPELAEKIKMTAVYSRVMPSQKLRLVEAFKKSGEIVAMTGDGVNDAPALKSAHVGIAMGARGTDVARESSDIVLLDDDFSSIVEAIRTGRRIYANIKNTLVYLFAIHIPIAGMAVLPVLLGLPLVLLPAHIALLHLIIEPASSIAFEIEPPSTDIMNQLPRSPDEALFNSEIWKPSFIRGFFLLVALVGVYFISLWKNLGESAPRTLVFTTLILTNTFLIFLSRGSKISLKTKLKNKPNPVVIGLSIASLLMLVLVLYVPTIRNVFKFSNLQSVDLLICLGVSTLTTLLSELIIELTKD
ncbi:MAG: cation-translocating P-type ATPase [Bacteriovorax sp.]|nr:cation-translocating P-type ATPase [Bacteriovorax sp.]